jgi:hypothetical protein
MVSKPRITVAYTKGDDGRPDEVLFYMNPEGRDLIVAELKRLDERWDHLHMQPEEWTVDLPLQMKAYVPGHEEPISAVKMMLRPDAWDRDHFPHVLEENKSE